MPLARAMALALAAVHGGGDSGAVLEYNLTPPETLCMDLCMPSKTISVDLDAYERLRRARQQPGESFSRVIKRACWASPAATGAALLERLEGSSPLSDEILDRLEKAQLEDLPPQRP